MKRSKTLFKLEQEGKRVFWNKTLFYLKEKIKLVLKVKNLI